MYLFIGCNFPAEPWYINNETGISSVQKNLSKIISTKGKKQVGALTSAERGQLVTALICCSASGAYMPPMLIFPRQRMKDELLDGSPPGTWAVCHPSGWIQKDLFLSWFKKFVKQSGASKDSKVLLIFDGHSTHTKSLELIDFANDNGGIFLCLPPHCTHKLQPLDVSFMKPLSTYYDHAVRKWLRTHPGRVVTQFQIASIFGEAYLNAATMGNAINGFKKTGIWSLDPLVFQEHDFLPASVTDIDLAGAEDGFENQSDGLIELEYPVSNCMDIDSQPPGSFDSQRPGPSSQARAFDSQRPGQTSAFQITPDSVMPLPHTPQKKRSNKRKGYTAVLTTSPYKRSLLESQQSKKSTTSKKGKAKATKKTDETDNTECLYCQDLYINSRESWVQCIQCQNWAHYSCAGLEESNKAPKYTCEICMED